MDITVTIRPEEEKALYAVMGDIRAWLQNAIRNRARQAIDLVCEDALGKERHHSIPGVARAKIAQDLANDGVIVAGVGDLSQEMKMRVIREATIKTALERAGEMEL